MIPFCWSKGGGSQESERELVVTRGTVRLVGAAVGTAEGRREGGRRRRREGRKEGEGEREERGEEGRRGEGEGGEI